MIHMINVKCGPVACPEMVLILGKENRQAQFLGVRFGQKVNHKDRTICIIEIKMMPPLRTYFS